jgi:hypothetical protein
MDKSKVIYRITCETCKKDYIGKTERNLKHRVKEHNMIHKNPQQDSAVSMHKRKYPDHDIDASNATIIDTAESNYKLSLKELMHIKKLKPALNKQHAEYKKNNNLFSKILNTIIISKGV